MEIKAIPAINIPDYLYQKATVQYQESVFRITDTMQNETVYTYDKNGVMISSVVNSHSIAVV